MEQVDGNFVDYTQRNNKGYFFLTCDKVMFPSAWKPPINWTGAVNGIKVEFVQINQAGSHRSFYDFSKFPQEIEYTIDDIIKAIDDAMRTMD